MSEERTVKCPICGEPYVFYPFFAGDQSACRSCREKARRDQWEPAPDNRQRAIETLRRLGDQA